MHWPPPPDWPNAAYSRQFLSRPHRWHVQEMGSGPTILFLHGTGASTHSFRDLMTRLAPSAHVVAIDLPGHGFTKLGTRQRSSLDLITEDVAHLLASQNWHPRIIVGHSAGAAIALRMVRFLGHPVTIFGLNPALETFSGIAGVLFPAMAKVIAMSPFAADLLSRGTARSTTVRQIIETTGSELSQTGIEYYRRLVADRDHVDGTLLMMAQWSLDGLDHDLPSIDAPCHFVTGSQDRTVPPEVATRVADRMQNAKVTVLDGLGHLAHEEDPDLFADLVLDRLAHHKTEKAADAPAAPSKSSSSAVNSSVRH